MRHAARGRCWPARPKVEDIIVRVKAGARGSTNASTIKWVIDDGAEVKEGDKLVELDDSGFQDQLKTQRNNYNKATSDWVNADCMLPLAMAATLATEPFEATAVATSPGTPHEPPSAQLRDPGGLEMALAIRPAIGK